MESKNLKTVAVDSRALEPDFRSHFGRGTGRYASEILSRLDKNEFSDFKIKKIRSKDLELSKFQRKISSSLPAGKVTYESQVCLNKNLKNTNPDIAHFFFHGDAPAYPAIPQIVSVLDLIPLKFPNLYQKGIGGIRYRFARYLEKRAIQASSGLITISKCSKRDIIEIMKIPEEKIHVTHLGVNNSFINNYKLKLNNEDKNALLQSLNIPNNGFNCLYIGGIDPRKNIPFLINVFSELNKCEKLKDLGGANLILAGKYEDDDQLPILKKLIRKYDLESKVNLVGYIKDSELSKLFSVSDLFVFPSLYEGFGLPVLEAMASGLPVIAGNNSSIPEVMGDTGWMINDNNLSEWVETIVDIIYSCNKDKNFLTLESENAHKRARLFTWDKTTQQTINIYRKYLKH